MSDLIAEILNPKLHFEGANNSANFLKLFSSLYNIELFKPGLDLILTRARNDQLKFEVKIIKGWDTNVGCYLTEQRKVYNKFLKTFTHQLDHKIILRNLLINVLAHEIAHALEVESELKLNETFRTAVGFDMKGRNPNNIALKGEIKRVMVEGVKSYPEYQIISELFARYFELLSISRNVAASGDFLTSDVMDFFANTTKFILEIFNPKIQSKIDLDISNYTTKLIAENAFKTEKKFAENTNSFHKKLDDKGQKSWSANTKSNQSWEKSWNQYQEKLEDKK